MWLRSATLSLGTQWQVIPGRMAQIMLRVSPLLLTSSIRSSCLLFLTSARLFTQPNFLTSLESARIRVPHGPTLLPSLRVTWHPNISGNDLAVVHSPRGCIPPLCIFHFMSIAPSNFQHPVPSWCLAALAALVLEGAGDLTLLPASCGRCRAGGHSGLCPCTVPR